MGFRDLFSGMSMLGFSRIGDGEVMEVDGFEDGDMGTFGLGFGGYDISTWRLRSLEWDNRNEHEP